MTGADNVQAVTLSLEILERLAANGGGMGVTSLAEACGASKSRVHRHLQTLAAAGYVTQSEPSEKYMIGSRLLTLGRRIAEACDFAQLSRALMRQLRENIGQSVVLSEFGVDGCRVLSTIGSKSAIEINVKPGSLLPYHCTAQGKIGIAFGKPSLASHVLGGQLERQTIYSITSPAALESELISVRRRGWAVAPNESLIGVNALAAPIFDSMGTLIGSLALVDSIQFLAEHPTVEQISALTGTAADISELIGYRKQTT